MSKRTRRGFSFIEVLFAIALLVVCGSIVVATMPIAGQARERANLNGLATGLASKQLEAIRGLGYAGVTPANLAARGLIDSATPVSADTFAWTNSGAADQDSPALRLPTGTGTITITRPGLDLVRVVVTVRYVYRGRANTVSTGTNIANL